MSKKGLSGAGVESGSHAPQRTGGRSSAASTKARTTAVLPTPASPATSTIRPTPELAAARACRRTSIGSSRSSMLGGAEMSDRFTGMSPLFRSESPMRGRTVS